MESGLLLAAGDAKEKEAGPPPPEMKMEVNSKVDPLRPFLVKSSVRVITTASQRTRFDAPAIDMGFMKVVDIHVDISGAFTDAIQVDIFADEVPLVPPHQSLSHIKVCDLSLTKACVSAQCDADGVTALPSDPSLLGRDDYGGLKLDSAACEMVLERANATPRSAANTRPEWRER